MLDKLLDPQTWSWLAPHALQGIGLLLVAVWSGRRVVWPVLKVGARGLTGAVKGVGRGVGRLAGKVFARRPAPEAKPLSDLCARVLSAMGDPGRWLLENNESLGAGSDRPMTLVRCGTSPNAPDLRARYNAAGWLDSLTLGGFHVLPQLGHEESAAVIESARELLAALTVETMGVRRVEAVAPVCSCGCPAGKCACGAQKHSRLLCGATARPVRG